MQQNALSQRFFPHRIFHRPSLARDYIIIVSLVVGLTITLIGIFSWYLYSSHQKSKNVAAVTASNRIEHSIMQSFDYASHLMTFFGQEIQKLGPSPDPSRITQLLRGELASDSVVKSLFSWTLFDWIDTDNKMVVSTTVGKIDNRIDMSHRSYTKLSHDEPWKLQFSEPSVGIPSGQWIVPAGMGITNHNGNFIGTIGMGFDIQKLTDKIERDIINANDNVSFIVLTDKYAVVAMSADNQININSHFYRDTLHKFNYFQNGPMEGYLTKPIEHNNIRYIYYNRIENTPFVILVGYNNALVDSEFYRVFYPLVSGLGLIAVLFITISFIIRKWLVDPVVELAAASERISQEGSKEHDIYIPRPKTRELHMLARQLVKVKSLLRRMRRTNHKLAIARDEADFAKERALALNKELKRYLRIIAHDICSPLYCVTGFAEILLQERFGKHTAPQYKEYAANILQVTNDVVEIARDLLDTGKLEDGRWELKNEPVHIEDVLDEVVVMEHQAASLKGIRVIKEYNRKDSHRLMSERKILLRICANLLSNAIKYSASHQGKHIWIQVDIGSDHLSINFRDEGFGIADVHEAVKPYNSLASYAHRNGTQSSGLGLYSVKQLVEELHGGELIIHSEIGKGSMIRCRFPKSRVLRDIAEMA